MGTTLHDWGGGTTPFYKCDDTPNAPGAAAPIDWTDGFHTVAMLWTESVMTVYVDDQVFAMTTTPDVMKMPYYILVNLGIGGGWPTEQTPDPSVMQVDYVRVWGQ